MAVDIFTNNAHAILSAAIATTPAAGIIETWSVTSSAAPLPQPTAGQQYRAVIDSEYVLVTGPVPSATTLTVTRGAEGSSPAVHASGATLQPVITGGFLGGLSALLSVVAPVTVAGALAVNTQTPVDASGSVLPAPTGVAVTTAVIGGSIGATVARFYKVTAVNAYGETTGSVEVTVTTGTGSVNANTVTWTVLPAGTSANIYASTSAGTETLQASGITVGRYTDTAAALAAGGAVPTTNTAGAGLTMTLPTGQAGVLVNVYKYDASLNTVTITGGAEGAEILTVQNQALQWVADSSGAWHPTSDRTPFAQFDGRYLGLVHPVEGAPFYAIGDSYILGTGATASNMVQRFGSRALVGSTSNRGVNAQTMAATLNTAVGDSANPTFAWSFGANGLIVLKSVINSIINISAANDAQEQIAFPAALKTILRLFRSRQWLPPSANVWAASTAYAVNNQYYSPESPSQLRQVTTAYTSGATFGATDTADTAILAPANTYTGTWAYASVPDTISTNTQKLTANTTGSVTVTTTEATVYLSVLGFPNVTRAFSVTVNGVAYATEITSTQIASTSVSWQIYLVPITGLLGTSTIVLTCGAGADFYFNGVLNEAAVPPTVIVGRDAIPTQKGIAINGSDTNRTPAHVTLFNNFVTSVCAMPEFANSVVAADPQPLYDNTVMESLTVPPHPNNMGHAAYADSWQIALQKIGYRGGVMAP